MKNNYYQIAYKLHRWGATQLATCHEPSIADAKLYGYSILNAYDVLYVIKTRKPI